MGGWGWGWSSLGKREVFGSCSPIRGSGFGDVLAPLSPSGKTGVKFPSVPSCSDTYTILLLFLIDGSNRNNSSYFQTIR